MISLGQPSVCLAASRIVPSLGVAGTGDRGGDAHGSGDAGAAATTFIGPKVVGGPSGAAHPFDVRW